MNRKVHVVLTIFVFSLFGAGCGPTSERKVTTVPLYEECERLFRSYIEETVKPRLRRGQDISLDYVYFDRRSEAHPSLVGYAAISNHNARQEEVDLYVNGLTTACYPRNYVAVELKEGTSGDIKNMLRRNIDQQITRNYFVYTDGEVRIYFNSKVRGSPEIEYKRGLSTVKAKSYQE